MGRRVRRRPARLLHRRHLPDEAQLQPDLRPAHGRPHHRRRAQLQRAGGRRVRHRHPRDGFRQHPVVAPPGLQLGYGRRRQVTAPRRCGRVLRPDPVRVDLEPVRQHRHRVHPLLRDRQQRARLRGRPRQSAQGLRRADERNQRHGQGFPLPAGGPHQPGLRPGTPVGPEGDG